jgi:hypothetical protein
MTRVVHGDTTYAILSKASAVRRPDSSRARETALQAGIVDHPAGYYSPPHAHSCERREIGENLRIPLRRTAGASPSRYSTRPGAAFGPSRLRAGDCAVLIRGGHSVRALEPTRLVEVKQGPYPGDGKAKVFRDAQ